MRELQEACVSKAGDHAYRELRLAILNGTFPPGSQIREEDVAELCGVSRTPVRDAMRRLEAEMFIRRTDSQRSYVAEWTIDDIEEVFTLRAMLEGHATRRAAMRVTPEHLAALEANNAAIRKAVEGGEPDVDAFLRHNAAYHALILEIAASERLGGLLNRLILQPIVQRTAQRYDRQHMLRSLAEHEAVVTALARGDAEWASALMTAHIRRAFHVYADRLGAKTATPGPAAS